MSLTVRASGWIQRLVERGDPAIVERLISNSRNDQEIASARRRDIGDANTFGEIAIVLLIKMIDQFPGRATRDTDAARMKRAHAPFRGPYLRSLRPLAGCAADAGLLSRRAHHGSGESRRADPQATGGKAERFPLRSENAKASYRESQT